MSLLWYRDPVSGEFEPYVGAGGSLITSGTMTTTGTLSLDNVFDASYDHYRIVIEAVSSSGSYGCKARLRAGGVDTTSTIYREGRWSVTSAPASSNTLNAALDGFTVGAIYAGYRAVFVFDIYGPFRAERTFLTHHDYQNNATTKYSTAIRGIVDDAVAYDGFTFLAATAGTFTGTYRVYGVC